MAEQSVVVGDLVVTTYKTGKYIAELMENSGDKALVKVVGVLRHPTQGDLHHPGEAKNVMFQQRRALAKNEKTWVHPRSLQKYEGEAPSYEESLSHTLNAEIDKLRKQEGEWAQRSIEQLEDLKYDYFK